MLAELEKEKAHNVFDSRAAVRCLMQEKTEIETKLGKLLDLHLDGGIERDAYVQKKNALLNRKLDIEQEMRDSEQKGDNRLEPVRELIIASREAKKYLSNSHTAELPTFLKKIGSNWVLQGRSVRWEAQKGWCALQNRANCSGWLGRRDSNPRMLAPEASALPLGDSPMLSTLYPNNALKKSLDFCLRGV